MYYCRLYDGTIIPAAWYKVLVWRENGNLQAEYIYTKHENLADVSLNTICTGMHMHVSYGVLKQDIDLQLYTLELYLQMYNSLLILYLACN